ncbi:MAG: NAD-dependent epimerase/dehydratase family protein, partial [Bdellovibrionota bacterium]
MANLRKTVLITGGCGFLGSHLAEAHLKDGYRVICVDNFSSASRSNESFLTSLGSENLVIVEADVIEAWSGWSEELPESWLEDLAYVFHFASPASPPLYQALALETMWVNSIGLSNALNFADKFGARVVFASTSEIYGDPEFSPQPESYKGNVNTVGIRSCYDEAKRFGESLIFTHNWKKNTTHGMVRIFNTYGPRMNPADGRVVINFLVQALQGNALTIYGDGSQTRSFCYVDDLVRGIRAYMMSENKEPINIGNPVEFTILQLIDEVQKLFPSKKFERSFHPFPKDDPRQRRPDISRARERLQWEPRVSLADGLPRMLEWLK